MAFSHPSNRRPLIKYLQKVNGLDSILDIGCGIGNIGKEIAEVFPDVRIDGVDISQDNVQTAYSRKTSQNKFVYRTIVHTDITQDQFFRKNLGYSIYVAFDVLPYIPKADGIKMVNNFRGRLVASLPFSWIQGAVSEWKHDEMLGLSEKCLFCGYAEGVYLV